MLLHSTLHIQDLGSVTLELKCQFRNWNFFFKVIEIGENVIGIFNNLFDYITKLLN